MVGVRTCAQPTATVQNTSNTAVTWQVSGVSGGNATAGTISSSGLYTAPAVVPNPATVTVTAVSQADPTKSASAQGTITPTAEIGRASCRERVEISVGAGSLKKKKSE